MKPAVFSILLIAGASAGLVSEVAKGQVVTAEAPGSPLSGPVQSIDMATKRILSNSALTARNTEVMRTVLQEKQKMTLAMAQAYLLSQHGIVLMGLGPANQIADQMRQMFSDPTAPPEPIQLGAFPEIQSAASIAGDLRSLVGSATDAVNDLQGVLNSVTNLSDSLQGLSGPAGVLDLADQGLSVIDAAGNVVNKVSGIYSRVDSLIYQGKRIVGLNWGDVGSYKTLLDELVAIERETPVQLLPFKGRTAAAMLELQGKARAFQDGYESIQDSYYQGQRLMDSSGRAFGFTAHSDAGRRQQAYQVGDGLYARRESPLDSAYYYMVGKGSGADALRFHAAVSGAHGPQYDPTVGYFQDGERRSRFNLNDVLTGGVFAAVERHLSERGTAAGNPLREAARVLAPVSGELLASRRYGQRVLAGSQDFRKAQAMPPVSLGNFGSLMALAKQTPADRMLAQAETFFCGFRRVSNVSGSEAVVAVQPIRKRAKEYLASVDGNEARLSQNARMLHTSQAMLDFSQEALRSATNLQAALTKLASEMQAINAIESLPLMIQNVDNVILILQRDVAKHARDIERYLGEQHRELEARRELVRRIRDENEDTAMARAIAAVMTGAPADGMDGGGSDLEGKGKQNEKRR